MSEKIFSIKDEKTNTDYKLTVSYNSFTIEFILQNATYFNEKYESGNLTLPIFHKKNKIFKQFDNILKIADVIRSKIEKKQYSLQSGVLTLKFHNEYDDIENIPFELKPVTGTTTTNAPEPQKSKPVSPPVQKSQNPPPSNPANDPFFYKPSKPEMQIVGSYVAPSMNKNGTIFERIENCKKLKSDMKKTCEDIYNRLLDVKKRIDNFVDKAFANNPTAEDKKKALSLITEVFNLRQGFKDMDDYAEIFKNEVKEKKINFNATQKEQFEDDMLLLGKAFPYSLTPFHQKIDHLFIQVQHNFFKEKNLRFYKDREIADILKLKEKLFNKM